MRKGRKFIGWLFIALMPACSWFDKEEPTPSYITIEPFEVTTDSQEGTAMQQLIDGWVFVNGQSLGIYELPVTLPVLESDNVTVRVDPGIKINGISGERQRYMFFNYSETTELLTPGQITTVTPQTTYINNLNFWIENFEDPGVKLTAHSSSEVNVTTTTDAFEGTKSGLLEIPNGNTYALIQTNENFVLPKLGSPVYLELHYKCNNHVNIGVIGNDGQIDDYHYTLTVTPTNKDGGAPVWNKIYIYLTEQVSSDLDAQNYELYFEMTKDPDVTDAEFYIDNIKLLHLN